MKLANSGKSHWASTFETSPKEKIRSTGPSPKTWYAMWTPSTVLA
jgi:hypothetical protein